MAEKEIVSQQSWRAGTSRSRAQLDQNATADPLKVLSIDLHSKGLSAVPPVAKVSRSSSSSSALTLQ